MSTSAAAEFGLAWVINLNYLVSKCYQIVEIDHCIMPLVTRVLKYPFQGQFAGEWRWPKEVQPDGWMHVKIPHVAGSHLSGVLGAAAGKPVGTLLLAHPLVRAAKGFWLKYGHAEYFRQQGFHVLAMDFNGFGESPDAIFDYPEDVLTAGKWLRDQYPDLPCGAVGASFGAAWIICAMARQRVFDAALIESTFPTLKDFWRRYPLPHATLRLAGLMMPRLDRSMRPIEQAPRIIGGPPVTLLYSRTDLDTPVSHGEAIQQAMAGASDAALYVADSAKHTHIFGDDPKVYQRAFSAFAGGLSNQRAMV